MDERTRYLGLLVSGSIAVLATIGIVAVSLGGSQPPPALAGIQGASLAIFATLIQIRQDKGPRQ